MSPSSAIFAQTLAPSSFQFPSDIRKEFVSDPLIDPTLSQTEEKACSFSARVGCIAQKIIILASSLTNETGSLTSVLRRLEGPVFDALAQLKGISGYLGAFRANIVQCIGVVDAFQFIGDVNYFASKQYKNEDSVKAASHVATLVANASWTLIWLEKMSFFTLSRVAQTVGNVRLFSFVPKIVASIPSLNNISGLGRAASSIGNIRIFGVVNRLSLGVIAGHALLMYYILAITDSIKTLAGNGHSTDKMQAGLELSNYLCELSIEAMFAVGVVNVAALGAMGAACIGTYLAAFAYRNLK